MSTMPDFTLFVKDTSANAAEVPKTRAATAATAPFFENFINTP